MKQSIFLHRPRNSIWYGVAALNLVFALFLFLNSAIADEGSFYLDNAVVSNPDPQERLNLCEQPSETLLHWENTTTASRCRSIKFAKRLAYVTIGDEGVAQGYMSTQHLAFGQDAQTVASANSPI